MDERRYEEAQVVAKQAAELDPKNPVVGAASVAGEVRAAFMQAKAIQDDEGAGIR